MEIFALFFFSVTCVMNSLGIKNYWKSKKLHFFGQNVYFGPKKVPFYAEIDIFSQSVYFKYQARK